METLQLLDQEPISSYLLKNYHLKRQKKRNYVQWFLRIRVSGAS